MRDLYIIKGIHFTDNKRNSERHREISLSQKVSRLIARELILREGIERVFRDGVYSSCARIYNKASRVEGKLLRLDSECDDVYESEVAWLEMIKMCKDEGVDISWAKTESDLLVRLYPLLDFIYGIENRIIDFVFKPIWLLEKLFERDILIRNYFL